LSVTKLTDAEEVQVSRTFKVRADRTRRETELAQAFDVVTRSAEQLTSAADAATLLVQGGPLVLEDQQYVQALLDMVNYNQTVGGALDALAGGTFRAGAVFSDDKRLAIEALLVQLIRDRDTARKGSAKLIEAIRGAVVCVPTFDPDKFTTGRRYRTVILSGEAAEAYALLLLLDPELTYYTRLRQCELPRCHHFFLFDPGARALPRRYCCKAHSKEGERLKTRERVRKHRHVPRARTNARRRK